MKLENKKEKELKQKTKKQSFKKSINEKQKGITLIALVITIIVLLILAGVSIATLTGDNGILTKAQTAKNETEKASEEEQIQLAAMNAAMNTKKYDYEVEDGTVPIPAGFAPTQIEGQNSIKDGLVITDSKGNEFVWVRVPKTKDVYKITDLNVTNFTDEIYENIKTDLKNYTLDYVLDGENYSDEWQGNYCGIPSATEYKKIYNNMLKGIYNNEGFWIGRYEVGYEENDIRDYEDVEAEHPINQIPVIKADTYPYNRLRAYQAQQLSSSFINDNEYRSSLMFEIQWDLTCKFIERDGGLSKENINHDSSSWGNYRTATFDIVRGSYSTDNGKTFSKVDGIHKKPLYDTGYGELLTTGANKRNSVLNIYDLAGNLWEYTLESVKTREAVGMRGGCYSQAGNRWTVDIRNDCGYTLSYDYVGFRVVLIEK